MKMNWVRAITLSAAALTLGSAAYGQSRLVADIPFSFRINGTEIPAGTYSVERMQNAGTNVVLLTNGHDHKMVMGISDYYGEQNAPRLVFSCREGGACTLAQVWDGRGAGVKFGTPKLTSAEKERLAVVYFRRSDATN